jgi:Domain of unknown function (DUF6970)
MMKKNINFRIAFIGVLFLFTSVSCNKSDLDSEIPKCIRKKIEAIQNSNVWNPPAKVWKWEDEENVYYHFSADCCDQFSSLYDSDCNLVCAPSGGFAGTGDGNCPNFSGAITKTLLWEDDRE